jgi:hypothetical protein
MKASRAMDIVLIGPQDHYIWVVKDLLPNWRQRSGALSNLCL